jgi:hypothetical protein
MCTGGSPSSAMSNHYQLGAPEPAPIAPPARGQFLLRRLATGHGQRAHKRQSKSNHFLH